LDSRNFGTRALAADILGFIGPPARPALPALRGRLDDQDQGVRVRAEGAVLRVLHATGPGRVADLTGLLADQHARARTGAAGLLGELGPPARPSLPALRRCLDDEDQNVRRAAEAAVPRLVPTAGPERVAALTGLLADRHAGIRTEAARLLGKLASG